MSKVSICTFGCRVNQYEAEKAAESARAQGHQIVEFGEMADVQIVHTCSVTKAAVRDGRQALRQALRTNPDGRVIASGCAARTDIDDLLPSPEVEVIGDLAQAVMNDAENSAVQPACLSAGPEPSVRQKRTRALLKIHDGCYFRCSFCIVPNARPVESSLPVEDAVAEARRYVDLGHREIVLTGVRITGYRPPQYLRRGLVELINRLGEVKGLERVRLTSLYPSEVKRDLLEALRDVPNACQHIHLALQSGDDDILAAMKRHYTSSQFEDVVLMARDLMPEISITSDVIAGFPGETDQMFQNTLSLMKRVKFSRSHVFTYSRRPGTVGADLPDQVQSRIAKERTRALISVAAETGRQYRDMFVGRVETIIVEQRKLDGWQSGLNDKYLEIFFRADDDLQGETVQVKVLYNTAKGLEGELVRVGLTGGETAVV